MKVLYYDCFSGISGDMNLGALIDLGVDEDLLRKELAKLKMDEEFELLVKKGIKNGVSGTKVDVLLKDKIHGHKHDHDHKHDHGHKHDHDHKHDHGHSHDHDHKHDHDHDHKHDHDHDHKHDHDHNHDHEHKHEQGHHHHHDRNFKIIREMIESSDLSDKVKKMSIDIFHEVAVAEAKVHGKTVDEVHFHEVGAVDSIVDVVGAAICIDALGVDKIMSSTVQLGGGFVMCDHGKIPVPAPATSEILKNVPIRMGLVPFETTTPTGAAILKANVDVYSDEHDMVIEKIGYGLGTKTFEVPNVLRVYLGRIEKKKLI